MKIIKLDTMAKSMEELTAELEQLKTQLLSKQTVTVQMPSNRKLRRYDGSTPVEEWIEDAESILQSNGLSGEKAGSYVYTSLEDKARDELRAASAEIRKDSQQIFQKLRDAFGEKNTISQLKQALYSRKQKTSESLLEYAHALTDVADRLERKKGFNNDTKDTILRDLFVDGVTGSTLRWELTKKVESEATTTFSDVRKLADQWHVLAGDRKTTVHAVNLVEPDPNQDLLKALVTLTEQNKGIMETLVQQQQQQQQLQQQLQQHQQQPMVPRPMIKCFFCGMFGHVQRNCRRKKAAEEGAGGGAMSTPVEGQRPLNE